MTNTLERISLISASSPSSPTSVHEACQSFSSGVVLGEPLSLPSDSLVMSDLLLNLDTLLCDGYSHQSA